MTYYDKAKVNLLTNVMNFNKTILNPQTRTLLPLGICWYRKWLGGLDHFDRWLHLYLLRHRNIKWTQALLSTLLKIAVNDTHIIASYLDIENTYKQTVLELIDHLAGSHTLRDRPVQSQNQVFAHWPVKITTSKDCTQCLSVDK